MNKSTRFIVTAAAMAGLYASAGRAAVAPSPTPTPTPDPVAAAVAPLQKQLDDTRAQLADAQQKAIAFYQQRNQLSVQILDLQYQAALDKKEIDDLKKLLASAPTPTPVPTPAPTVPPIPSKSDK